MHVQTHMHTFAYTDTCTHARSVSVHHLPSCLVSSHRPCQRKGLCLEGRPSSTLQILFNLLRLFLISFNLSMCVCVFLQARFFATWTATSLLWAKAWTVRRRSLCTECTRWACLIIHFACVQSWFVLRTSVCIRLFVYIQCKYVWLYTFSVNTSVCIHSVYIRLFVYVCLFTSVYIRLFVYAYLYTFSVHTSVCTHTV